MIQRRPVTSVPRDAAKVPRPDLTDSDRLDFLYHLDKAKLEVTAWEADFLASNWTTPELLAASKARPQPNDFFSSAQRFCIEQMIKKYASRIGW